MEKVRLRCISRRSMASRLLNSGLPLIVSKNRSAVEIKWDPFEIDLWIDFMKSRAAGAASEAVIQVSFLRRMHSISGHHIGSKVDLKFLASARSLLVATPYPQRRPAHLVFSSSFRVTALRPKLTSPPTPWIGGHAGAFHVGGAPNMCFVTTFGRFDNWVESG